ncbi:MAG TPA: hypothetical protein VEK79_17295 [Thermoanaerobaculia bacterium]|nr:hypothetical protein [Thermoanaerobaculia bacterium]
MRFVIPLAFASLAVAFTASATVDDRLIKINSPARAEAVRAELRNFIWGTTVLPSATPKATPTASPVSGLVHPITNASLFKSATENGLTVTALDVVRDCEVSRAYYFEAASPNGTVMLLHAGHDHMNVHPPDDAKMPGNDSTQGAQRFIRALLLDGYSVVLCFLPHYRPYVEAPPGCTPEAPGVYPNAPVGNDPKDPRDHAWMFRELAPDNEALKYFLEPVVQWVNYVTTRTNASGALLFSRVVMTGLSGGGWTTTLAAAIDPRIVRSYPVAGTIPLYMRQCLSSGDTEQFVDSLYQIAGYLDLYVLGTYPSRKQIQILLRHDLYFGDDPITMFKGGGKTWEQLLRPYESLVRNVAHSLGSGATFHLEIDEGAIGHNYSRNGAFNVILGDLNEDRPGVGAAGGTDMFIRSAGGQIIEGGAAGWSNTGLFASGTPEVVENAAGTQRLDLFYRNEKNMLQHVFRTGSEWSSPVALLPETTRALTDPVAVANSTGIDIVATAAVVRDGITTNPLFCAHPKTQPPFLGDDGTTRIDFDVYHWTWTPSGLSEPTNLTKDGFLLYDTKIHRAPVGMPAVVQFQGQLHVFVRGEDAVLYHLKRQGTDWVEQPMSTSVLVNGSPRPVLVGGFPVAVVANGAMRVYSRSLEGRQLWEFSGTGSGVWTGAPVPSVAMTGSPSATVTPTEVKVFVRGLDGRVVACRRPVAGTQWSVDPLGGSPTTGSPVATQNGVAVRSSAEVVARHNGETWSSKSTVEAVPLTFTATRIGGNESTSSIQLAWTKAAADRSNSFVIERSDGGAFSVIGPPVNDTNFIDTVTNGRSYIYRVRSATSPAYKADLATAATFAAIPSRGAIKAENLQDARRATNMVRAVAELPWLTFPDPAKAPVRAADITTLRAYMAEAFLAAMLPARSFSAIATKGRVHADNFTELIDAVK